MRPDYAKGLEDLNRKFQDATRELDFVLTNPVQVHPVGSVKRLVELTAQVAKMKNPRELYTAYMAAHAEQDCIVDETWEELSDFDKRMWTRMAELIGQ